MALATERVARRCEDVVAGTPISVDIPAYDTADVYVYYGNSALLAVYNTDYTISLAADFSTITVTPLASLLTKINALIAADATETNFIVVRRDLEAITSATPATARNTGFLSDEFDRNAMRDAQLKDGLDRTIQRAPTAIPNGPLVLEEPQAGRALMYNDDAQRVVAGPTADQIADAQSYAEAAAAALAEALGTTRETFGFANVAEAQAATISSIAKVILTHSLAAPGDGGAARYRRISKADIDSAGYPSQAYFRTVDRFMPDGTTDATNGGYWVIDDDEPTIDALGGTLAPAATVSKITGKRILGAPGKTYNLDTLSSHVGSARFDLRGARLHKTASGGIAQFRTDLSGPFALSANYTKGSYALNVADTGTALRPGQHILVMSDAVHPRARDEGSREAQSRCCEWVIVGENSTTTQINLTRPLQRIVGISPTSIAGDEPRVDAYTTAMNARVYVPDMDQVFEFRNAVLSYEDGHDAGEADEWVGIALSVAGYRRPIIDNVRQTKGYSSMLNISGTNEARIARCFADDLADATSAGQFGYGISDKALNTLVADCGFTNCRSATDTGGQPITVDETGALNLLSAAASQGFRARHGTGSSPPDRGTAVFGCHSGIDDLEYEGLAVSAGKIGMALRGRGTRAIAPRITGTQFGILALTPIDSGDPDDDLRLAGALLEDFSDPTIIDPLIWCEKIPLSCEAARLTVEGTVDLKSAGHRLIKGAGEDTPDPMHGHLEWGASGHFRHDTQEGRYAVFEEDGKGVFDIEQLTEQKDRDAFTNTKVEVRGGVDMTFDVEDTTSTGIFGINSDASSSFTNRGRLLFKLPADGKLFSADGIMRTVGDGLFVVTLKDVADNANDHNLIGRRANVAAGDGSIVWWAPRGGGELQPIYENRAKTILAGAGAEAFSFNVDNLRRHLATVGGGTFQIRQQIAKVGGAAEANIAWWDFGTFLHDLDIGSDTNQLIDYTLTVTIESTTEWTANFAGQVMSASTGLAIPFGGFRKVTYSGSPVDDLLTAFNGMVALNLTVGGADILRHEYTSLHASEGGIF